MKILVPIDFSENSVKALKLALALNQNKKSTIILAHIIELVYDFAAQAAIALDSMYTDAKKLLDEIENTHQADHLTFQKIIEDGTASISLARIASAQECDLIVIGTSGAGGIKKLMMGSTTKNLLRESKLPVLVVPADAKINLPKNLTMAIQFANHEKSSIATLVTFGKAWDLPIQFLHIQTEEDFKAELAGIGLSNYLEKMYSLDANPILTSTHSDINEGLQSHFEPESEAILVMCHQHKTLWRQFIETSHSMTMTYQSTVPLLVLV